MQSTLPKIQMNLASPPPPSAPALPRPMSSLSLVVEEAKALPSNVQWEMAGTGFAGDDDNKLLSSVHISRILLLIYR
jgi:hypothetical protein